LTLSSLQDKRPFYGVQNRLMWKCVTFIIGLGRRVTTVVFVYQSTHTEFCVTSQDGLGGVC
jgi:hypothetical protein